MASSVGAIDTLCSDFVYVFTPTSARWVQGTVSGNLAGCSLRPSVFAICLSQRAISLGEWLSKELARPALDACSCLVDFLEIFYTHSAASPFAWTRPLGPGSSDRTRGAQAQRIVLILN